MTACFVLLLTVFVALSLVYVASSGKIVLARLFEMPVVITVLAVMSFGLASLEALIAPDRLDTNLQVGKGLLIAALVLVVVGMIAFWTGCKLVEPMHKAPRVLSCRKTGGGRVVAVALFLYVVGFVSKIYLLQNHLFSFTASPDRLEENLANAQLFTWGSQFATVALLMLCIEKHTRPSAWLVRGLFLVVFCSECVWGLISGMKSLLLLNFAAVALVSTILKGRLAAKWVIAAVAGLVIIYPLSNSYRAVIRGENSVEITDFGAAAKALSLGAASAMQSTGGSSDWLQSGSESSLSRFDLLPNVAFILNLGRQASETHGDTRLWMIPYYPFVPRIIWPSKPVLDQGVRFSALLGWGTDTSTPVTYPADCYIYGGIAGLIGGMLLLGIFAQVCTNSLNGLISKYHVLKYSVLLLLCVRIEIGVIDVWVGVLKTLPVLFVIGWAAYGRFKYKSCRNTRSRPIVTRHA